MCEPIKWKEGKVGTYLEILFFLLFLNFLVCIFNIINPTELQPLLSFKKKKNPTELFIQDITDGDRHEKGAKRPYTSERSVVYCYLLYYLLIWICITLSWHCWPYFLFSNAVSSLGLVRLCGVTDGWMRYVRTLMRRPL